jgi:hypothetical protein
VYSLPYKPSHFPGRAMKLLYAIIDGEKLRTFRIHATTTFLYYLISARLYIFRQQGMISFPLILIIEGRLFLLYSFSSYQVPLYNLLLLSAPTKNFSIAPAAKLRI